VHNGPEDLKELSQDQLTRLAGEIRDLLIETTTRTSGHLGPNLGVVELTIAIHRVFDSPKTGSSSIPATSRTCTSCSPGGSRSSARCGNEAA